MNGSLVEDNVFVADAPVNDKTAGLNGSSQLEVRNNRFYATGELPAAEWLGQGNTIRPYAEAAVTEKWPDPGDSHDEGGYSLEGGFGVGLLAFFGMLFLGVGTGVAAPSATANPGARRGVTAILAFAWHGVGVGACWCYCVLAPALDVWPFLTVLAYEWLGLVPLALAVPDGERTGRLRSAIWYAMGGGLATGIVFAVRRLAGWEMSGGEEKEEGDEEEGRELQTAHSMVCRKCRMPVDSHLVDCPYCRSPVQARRDWPVGRVCTGVGLVCVAGTWFGWNVLKSWLVGKGFPVNPTVLNYLFWMFFVGGWIMIGLGSLLGSAKPAPRTGNRENPADDSERGVEDHELSG